MSASLPIEILKKYKGNFTKFFETGTSTGDSTQTALDAGFEEIFTVEFYKPTYEKALKKFEFNEKVHVYHSESVGCLKAVLPFIEDGIVFFLDAHASCDQKCTPMLEELDSIKGHKFPIVVMIDDMRLLGLQTWKKVTIPILLDKLKEVNPNFEIVFEDNQHGVKGDLLVAFDPAVN